MRSEIQKKSQQSNLLIVFICFLATFGLLNLEQELKHPGVTVFNAKQKDSAGTAALSQVVSHAVKQHRIDYVFYDSGPNIGALNRIILLDCDYFAIPVACDLFSLRAITTLGHTLDKWIRDIDTISGLAPSSTELLLGRPKLIELFHSNFGYMEVLCHHNTRGSFP